MSITIYLQQIEHPNSEHYRQIINLSERYLSTQGHEPLNEVMLISLEQAIKTDPDADPEKKQHSLPNLEQSIEKQTHLPSVRYRCSFFAYFDDINMKSHQSPEISSANITFIEPIVNIIPDRIGGYLQLSYGHGHWHAAMIIPEPESEYSFYLTKILLRASARYILDNGGGTIQLFVPSPPDNIVKAVEELSFKESSVVLSMKKRLVSGDQSPIGIFQKKKISEHRLSAEHNLLIRPFRIGYDENAWLDLNHRAFENHLDQGRWTPGDLIYRENLSWFNQEGFLMMEIDAELAGFCWTKIVKDQFDSDLKIGEIYILAVDAKWQGHGLGAILLSAGISYLNTVGITICSLYCESSNASAVKLYESLGFESDHRDILYTLELTKDTFN